MSLQLRLIVSVALVLGLGVGLGGLLAGWHATRTVRIEMRASLLVGQQTLEAALGDLDDASMPGESLRELIAAFDGNRHVRATLLDAAGQPVATSRLAASEDAPPGWFRRLPGAEFSPISLALPAGLPGAVELRADPVNELGEVWGWLRVGLLATVAFYVPACLLIHWIVGRALRPLAAVSQAFRRIGSGDYAVRLARRGSPEVMLLADGLNRMAARLAAVDEQNRRLSAQLQTLQEEERAGLARDLHDEVGPFLFAANLDAAEIGRLIAAGRTSEVADRAQAVREAIGHVQRHVRAVLRQLRPLPLGAPGVASAVGTLVAFWQRRNPDIVFEVTLPADEAELSEPVRAAACRIVQEGLSNAVRHARPERIGIEVDIRADEVVVQVTDDGDGPGAGADGGGGLGLPGMRERVALLGGTLDAGPRPGRCGMEVTARLPLRQRAEQVSQDLAQ